MKPEKTKEDILKEIEEQTKRKFENPEEIEPVGPTTNPGSSHGQKQGWPNEKDMEVGSSPLP